LSDPSTAVNIDLFPPPTNVVIDTNAATNGYSTGSLNASATGTNLEYSINGNNWYPNGTFTGLDQGWDTLMIRDGNGCITNFPFLITNQSAAVPTLIGDKNSACPGDIIAISIIGMGVTNYSGVNICISYDPALAKVVGIPYHAPEFLNYGYDYSTAGQVYLYDNITPLITIADGDTLFTIQFQGLQYGNGTLDWSDFKPGICGMTNQNGVSLPPNVVPAILNFYRIPTATILSSSDACEGTSFSLSAAGDTLTHVWTLPDGSSVNGQQYTIPNVALSDAGAYLLTTTNTLLCVDTSSLLLSVHPKPQVALASSDPVCVETVEILSPGSSYASYIWNDGSTGPSIPNQGEGTYWVIIKDVNGCEGTDSLTLVVCPATLFVPSAFSPNSDGTNDAFKARYSDTDVLNNYKMIIYNRWGQLLFETNDINLGWDGKFKGESCPAGVYTYVIKFDKPVGKTFAQKNPLRGMVTLVR
jgi:gliding motility-associated-like protein